MSRRRVTCLSSFFGTKHIVVVEKSEKFSRARWVLKFLAEASRGSPRVDRSRRQRMVLQLLHYIDGRAVVDDDDLIRAVGLGKDAFDCLMKVNQAVIDRDDDADQRLHKLLRTLWQLGEEAPRPVCRSIRSIRLQSRAVKKSAIIVPEHVVGFLQLVAVGQLVQVKRLPLGKPGFASTRQIASGCTC